MEKKTHFTLSFFLSKAIASDIIKRVTKVIYYGNNSVQKNYIPNSREPDLSVSEYKDHRVTLGC